MNQRDWHNPATGDLPEHGQVCLIVGKINPEATRVIPWLKNEDGGGAWVDLFATPEAGESFGVDVVGWWTDWAAIAPPTPEELAEDNQ